MVYHPAKNYDVPDIDLLTLLFGKLDRIYYKLIY